MKQYNCRFESLGTEFFFDEGFICEQASFERFSEPALRDEKMSYIADALAALINWEDVFYDREVLARLKDLGIERYQFPAMLRCFLDGEPYKDMVLATGLRIGLYEIQLGLRIWREDDEEHNAYSYLSIPLGRSSGFITLQGMSNHMRKVKIAWKNGMVNEIRY